MALERGIASVEAVEGPSRRGFHCHLSPAGRKRLGSVFLPPAIAGDTEARSRERVGIGITTTPSTLRASESPATAGRGWLKFASPSPVALSLVP